jgi:hypothetical protein
MNQNYLPDGCSIVEIVDSQEQNKKVFSSKRNKKNKKKEKMMSSTSMPSSMKNVGSALLDVLASSGAKKDDSIITDDDNNSLDVIDDGEASLLDDDDADIDEMNDDEENTNDDDDGSEDMEIELKRIQLQLAISQDLRQRMELSPLVNAALSGNTQMLDTLLLQGLFCPKDSLRLLYSICAGFPCETTGFSMLDMIRSSSAACCGDSTSTVYKACQECQLSLSKSSTTSSSKTNAKKQHSRK